MDNPTKFPCDIADRCPAGIIYIGEKPENISMKELMKLWREHKSNQLTDN